MRSVDKQFIRDIQWLYRVAQDFSNRLQTSYLVSRVLGGEIGLDIFESAEFGRVILKPLCGEIVSLGWSREKLAKAISLGCTGHYTEKYIHIYERFAIDDAIGERDASRTPVTAMEECARGWEGIPDGRWSVYLGDWMSMNGMERLRYQAALVIAAAIRDLERSKYLLKKRGRTYIPQMGPLELADLQKH